MTRFQFTIDATDGKDPVRVTAYRTTGLPVLYSGF